MGSDVFATISEGFIVQTLVDTNLGKDARKAKIDQAMTKIKQHSKLFKADIKTKIHKEILASGSTLILE